jgi:SUKH-3 immunity protein
VTSSFGLRTRRCLETAGWRSDERRDVSSAVKALTALGVEVSPAVRAFLEQFGGLRLTYPHFRDSTRIDYCHFDAGAAIDSVFPDNLRAWEKRIGMCLSPIGEAFQGYATLLMSTDGKVYAAIDDSVFRVAESGAEAVENLCEGREPEPLAP